MTPWNDKVIVISVLLWVRHCSTRHCVCGTLLNWDTICCEKLQVAVNYKVIGSFSWRPCVLEQNVRSCSQVLAGWLTQALPTPQMDGTLFTAKTFISCHGCELSKCGFYAMAALLPRKEPRSTHCVGGGVGPRGSLDVLEKGEVLHLL
jgi:hypothetical protein